MQQHPLAPRQAPPVPAGYESMTRSPATFADAGMIARHEYRTRQRQPDTTADSTATAAAAGSRAAALLELRRRQLALLSLG